jgi:hypothetical protein
LGDIRILPLVKSEPEAWALMPEALARIEKFCGTYDADSTPEVLRQAVMEHFVADDAKSSVRVLVALRDGRMIGHTLVSLDAWCGKTYLTVVQFETDAPIPRHLVRDAMEQAAWWAKGKGASVMRVLARTDERGAARARAFRAFYGFCPKRVVMDRSL